MILLIDNYDSFTYNLVQLIGGLGAEVHVERNDRLTAKEAYGMKPSHIVLSPGPGRPEDAGICVALVRNAVPQIPLLGVCLGHQAIGHAFGGRIVHAPSLHHGKSSDIHHDGKGLFENVANPFEGGRYHSLVVSREDLPDELEITARTGDNIIMGLRHRSLPVEGVQFHPESILTPAGRKIMSNWLHRSGVTP
jgi:anthranilate synthase component II